MFRGVDIDASHKALGGPDVLFLDSSVVDQVLDLGQKIGRGAQSILRQQLFRNQAIPAPATEVPAIKTKVGSVTLYKFFATASQLIDLAYVHRREPANADISTSYQRFVEPSRVAAIGKYLSDPKAFFPDGIVLATPKPKWTSHVQDGVFESGMLQLPNVYGSLWVIDGQHRLFGSAATPEGRKKPISVVALEGLGPLEQGELFRTINEKQKPVSKELIWDIYGDLDVSDVPTSDKDREAFRRRTISRIWKRINQSSGNPFAGAIIIPSQTVKSDACFIKLGFLCDALDSESLWQEGRLRPADWHKAENYAFARVSAFLKALHAHNQEVWKLGKKGWLLNGYSQIVLFDLFRHMAIMFSEAKYQNRWKAGNKADALIDEFVRKASEAMRHPTTSYASQIEQAGNQAARGLRLRKLVEHLRTKGYETLAPNLKEEQDSSDRPGIEILLRVRSVEKNLRDLVYATFYADQQKGWWTKVPAAIRSRVEEQMRFSIAHAGGKGSKKPTREWLDGTTLFDVQEIITEDKNWTMFSEALGGHKNVFEQYFPDFYALRNLVMHDKTYPGEQAKVRWLAALEWVEGVLEARKPLA